MNAAWTHQKNKVILSGFALYQRHLNINLKFDPFFMDYLMIPAWIHQNCAVLDGEPLLIQKVKKIWVRHGHLGGLCMDD